jgi:ATP-dependent exoDNAse (exonuclease V) alpha subunit
MTGEDKQLDAINRGGALRYLSKPEIIGTQRIQNIRRQRSEWSRQVVADLRDGRSLKALKALEQHSCMHWGENNDVTKLKLIKHWYEYQTNNPEKNTLVMAQRWKDVKDLSEIIRAIHIEEGRVGIENIPLKCSVAEKQFDFEFSCGDRIKFCRNDYTNLKVSNGTLGTIKEIRQLDNGDVELVIETDDQREVSFLASEYSDERGANICLAYALTVYSAQGTTVDGNTFTLYSGGMDRANSYVALSRNKDEAHLFINRSEIDERAGAYDAGESVNDYQRFQTLCKLMSRDNYSSLAIEQLPALDITENLSLEKSMEL